MEQQCCHRVFLEGKCTTCKKLIIDCKDVTTVAVNYIHPGVSMSLSNSTMDRIRDADLRAVLTRKKLNLILDLDNTLLNSKQTEKFTSKDKQRVVSNPKNLYEVEGESRMVKLRPGAREFLKKARDMFELSIYTMGTRDYAHKMADLLAVGSGLDGRSMFGKIISREDCTEVGKKGLDVVLSSKRVVLIVDDKEDVWEDSCKANVVKIKSYRFFRERKAIKKVEHEDMDRGLRKVLSTLSSVHSTFYEDNSGGRDYLNRDVRQVLAMVRGKEEEKTRVEEKIALGKRLRETNAQPFIERFCAPVTKRYKKISTIATNTPCLV
ncbi:hypothetical protein vseg_002267 [Gypsophila vaccaria]